MAGGPLDIGDLLLSVKADIDGLRRDLETKAPQAAASAGKKASVAFGSEMKKGLMQGIGVGAGFGIAAGTAAVIGGVTDAIGGAIDAAAKWERSLSTINTVAKLSDQQIGDLGLQIQELSVQSGKGTADLAAGMYDLVSAGVDAADAMGVLNDATTLAIGGLGTTAETVDLLTSVLNAYGLEAEESTRITDVFAQSIADGKVTAAQLGQSIATIAPIAAEAGVTIEEVAAGFANLTATGVPAAEAATKMRSAVVALLTPNSELARVQRETGISFGELMKAQGAAVALQTLYDAVGGSQEVMANALGRVEAYQYALAVTGDNADDFAESQKRMETAADEGGVAAGQAAEMMDDFATQQERFNAALDTMNVKMGEFLIGPGADFLEWLTAGIAPKPTLEYAVASMLQKAGVSIEGFQVVGAEAGTAAGEAFDDAWAAAMAESGTMSADEIAAQRERARNWNQAMVQAVLESGLGDAIAEATPDNLFDNVTQAEEVGRQLHEIAEALGVTDDAIIKMAEDTYAANGSLEQTIAVLDSAGIAAREAGRKASMGAGWYGDAVEDAAASAQKAVSVFALTEDEIKRLPDAMRDFAGSLELVRNEEGKVTGVTMGMGQSFREAKRTMLEMLDGPDLVRKSIRELTKQMGFWERVAEKALKQGRRDLYNFAVAQSNSVATRLADQQLLADAYNAEKVAQRDTLKEAVAGASTQREQIRLVAKQYGVSTRVVSKMLGRQEGDIDKVIDKLSGLDGTKATPDVEVKVDDSELETVESDINALDGSQVRIVTRVIGGKKITAPEGFLAEGGPVRARHAYVVGERGPEYFVPTADGYVFPDNERLGRFEVSRGGSASGPTLQMAVHGLPMRARTPVEVAMQAARAARLGYFAPPRPETAWEPYE